MSKEKIVSSKKSKLQKMAEYHPHQLVLYLFMFGSSIIFFFIIVALLATTSDLSIYWSKYFSYSTAILLISAYPVSRVSFLFETERFHRMLRALASTMFFGSLFVILQIFGWSEMNINMSENETRQSEFMYVLSGLHILHVAILLIITAYFSVYFGKKLSDPVSALIVSTNPYEALKLKMLTHSWIFLHIIWAIIFITFLMGQE